MKSFTDKKHAISWLSLRSFDCALRLHHSLRSKRDLLGGNVASKKTNHEKFSPNKKTCDFPSVIAVLVYILRLDTLQLKRGLLNRKIA